MRKCFIILKNIFNRNLNIPENSFAIYADNKTIVIVEDEYVEDFMNRLRLNFEKREKYHGCHHMTGIIQKWRDYVKGGKAAMEKKWEDYLEKRKDEK